MLQDLRYRNPEDLMGEGGIFKQLSKALIERCLSAELDPHLAEEKAASEIDALGGGKAETPRNRRNGHSKKTIKWQFQADESSGASSLNSF
jgi:transposase-like protein